MMSMKTQDKQEEKIFVEYDCNLCGHHWISRTKKPMTCPRCKRYDYGEENVKTN